MTNTNGMFWRKKKKRLANQIDKLNDMFEKSNIREIAYVLGDRRQIFIRNLLAGISRGIGIGIGVTFITAMLIFIL